MGKEYFKLDYGVLTRFLPVCKINSEIEIAGFDSVGDTRLLEEFRNKISRNNYSEEMTKNIKAIITTEVKGICPAMIVAEILKVPVIVLRKSKKVYMENPVEFLGNSITSGNSNYFVDINNINKLKAEHGDYCNVLFVDDVYSTGGTMNAIEYICQECMLHLVGGLFILKEEDSMCCSDSIQFNHNDIKCVATGILPIGDSLRNNKFAL